MFSHDDGGPLWHSNMFPRGVFSLACFPRRRRIVGAFRSRQEFGRVLQHILIRAAGHRWDRVLLKHGQPVVPFAIVLLDTLVW
jgi:hypothetical protein